MVLIEGLNLTEHKPALKMGGFISINVDVNSNAFCMAMRKADTICRHCYAYYMETRYPRLKAALVRNYELLSDNGFIDYSAIAQHIVKHGVGLRFDSIGELINDNHVRHLNNIARAVHEIDPKFPISIWSKRVELARKIDKTHITVIYSNPVIDDPMARPPDGFNGVFNVNTYQHFKRENYKPNCSGKCRECKQCYTHGRNGFVINELIKGDQQKIRRGKLAVF